MGIERQQGYPISNIQTHSNSSQTLSKTSINREVNDYKLPLTTENPNQHHHITKKSQIKVRGVDESSSYLSNLNILKTQNSINTSESRRHAGNYTQNQHYNDIGFESSNSDLASQNSVKLNVEKGEKIQFLNEEKRIYSESEKRRIKNAEKRKLKRAKKKTVKEENRIIKEQETKVKILKFQTIDLGFKGKKLMARLNQQVFSMQELERLGKIMLPEIQNKMKSVIEIKDKLRDIKNSKYKGLQNSQDCG